MQEDHRFGRTVGDVRSHVLASAAVQLTSGFGIIRSHAVRMILAPCRRANVTAGESDSSVGVNR